MYRKQRIDNHQQDFLSFSRLSLCHHVRLDLSNLFNEKKKYEEFGIWLKHLPFLWKIRSEIHLKKFLFL